MIERIIAYGHENVTSRHRTTLEVTKDEEISKKGDCIIGVKADKGIADLSEEFKVTARDGSALIELTISANGVEEKITGRGHPELTFTHPTDMVARKSEFICDRTIMIKADKSSKELKRDLVERLKDPDQRIEVRIDVK
jgi:hypothetical protein